MADVLQAGEAFLTALAARDFRRLETCLDPMVRFRVLVPPGPRERSGATETASQLERWFAAAFEFEVLQTHAERVADRPHVAYRFRLQEDASGWKVVEQHAYCDVRDGRIAAIDLLCSASAPRPPRRPRSPRSTPTPRSSPRMPRRALAERQAATWAALAARVPDDAAVLAVSHGGLIELVSALLAERLGITLRGGTFSYCEGLRVRYRDGAPVSLEPLRGSSSSSAAE